MSLFDPVPAKMAAASTPLAERMRPERLEDFLGQEHILGAGKPLREQIERVQQGLEPLGIIRDPERNQLIDLGVINERIGLFAASDRRAMQSRAAR